MALGLAAPHDLELRENDNEQNLPCNTRGTGTHQC